jgi:hypothetical protein
MDIYRTQHPDILLILVIIRLTLSPRIQQCTHTAHRLMLRHLIIQQRRLPKQLSTEAAAAAAPRRMQPDPKAPNRDLKPIQLFLRSGSLLPECRQALTDVFL